MARIMQCTICNRLVARNKTKGHFMFQHKRLPPSAMRYTQPKCAKFFIQCLVCHKTIGGAVKHRIDHQQKYHSELPASKLFNNKKVLIENAVKCILCKNFIPVKLSDSHLKEEHPGEHSEQMNVNKRPNPNTDNGTVKSDKEETSNGSNKIVEPANSRESKQDEIEVDDVESEEQIFVRCDYCGKELLPSYIDDHILQEHVTGIEENDEDDNDDSVSLSSHKNGNNSANEQHSETNQKLNDSKASIVSHVNCEHCSKKVRLDKIEKHIQRKHSNETETKKKLKRKIISETGSVDIMPANKSRTVSESVSLNGDEYNNERCDEEEFYTIYVTKNELEKFLLAKRVYPKNGMFHLKNSPN